MMPAMDRRAIVLVLDGCGAGAAPDAAAFGDPHQPSTLKNVWDAAGGFAAPVLGSVGFLAAGGIGEPAGRSGRLRPLGMGKDSVTGHWEMMGAVVEKPFPTYPGGFPPDLVAAFEASIGRKVIGNKAASGTAILEELGQAHLETGSPILYTSADSVFQVAAHEEVVPVEELYSWCRLAREICSPPHDVQRVIARPFIGSPGAWKRTERRKDFPLAAPPNLVDVLAPVRGIGVVPQLFDGRGFVPLPRSQNNREHGEAVLAALEAGERFIFANFEDFDMLYGHRSDPAGFARCLEEFDQWLGGFLPLLHASDLLILTADHGNDPTDTSTDHTREYVPVAVVNGGGDADLGDVEGLAAVGATVAAWLGVDWDRGKSLLG